PYACLYCCRVSLCVFFFSSRRRHTSFSRDWSSDVCSSDLCRQTRDAIPSRRGPQPIRLRSRGEKPTRAACPRRRASPRSQTPRRDRKSTRLNSSHVKISYAVFCLKKKTISIYREEQNKARQ